MFRKQRWERRRVEQALAHQLSAAREHFRLTNQTLQDAMSGADPTTRQEIERQLSQAKDASSHAQRRWLSFVNEGIIPDDLAGD